MKMISSPLAGFSDQVVWVWGAAPRNAARWSRRDTAGKTQQPQPVHLLQLPATISHSNPESLHYWPLYGGCTKPAVKGLFVQRNAKVQTWMERKQLPGKDSARSHPLPYFLVFCKGSGNSALQVSHIHWTCNFSMGLINTKLAFSALSLQRGSTLKKVYGRLQKWPDSLLYFRAGR